MADLVVPTIHLNGTSKEALQKQIQDAHFALSQAHNALYKMSPHGRDYYPQGEDKIRAAIEQHVARIQKIEEVMAELVQIHTSME